MIFEEAPPARPGSTTEARVVKVEDGRAAPAFDRLATEEPLEIRLRAGGAMRSVAITMRTPGADFELAAGFLYGEGVIAETDAIAGITYCIDPDVDAAQRYNIVNVDLAAAAFPVLDTLERHFTMTSACGVCGKAQLDALRDRGVPRLESTLRIAPALICSLPDRLRSVQRVFATTGGLGVRAGRHRHRGARGRRPAQRPG
jgi:FdhD protein